MTDFESQRQAIVIGPQPSEHRSSNLPPLYHGSSVSGIKTLNPQAHKLFSDQVIFASSDTRFALAMIYGNDTELGVGYFESTKTGELQMYISELQPGKL